jgi:hypothetical protein
MSRDEPRREEKKSGRDPTTTRLRNASVQLGHDYVNVDGQSLAGRIPHECEHLHATRLILNARTHRSERWLSGMRNYFWTQSNLAYEKSVPGRLGQSEAHVVCWSDISLARGMRVHASAIDRSHKIDHDTRIPTQRTRTENSTEFNCPPTLEHLIRIRKHDSI